MNGSYQNSTHVFDVVFMQAGQAGLTRQFEAMLRSNRPRALSLLNDPSLSYPSFFLLIPQILSHQLSQYLSPQKQFALAFTIQYSPETDYPYAKDTFTWMLLTSLHRELDSEDFQDTIDKVVTHLLLVYDEHSLLPKIVELIFLRNRKDDCIYDLCWVIFQAQTVKTLPYVAAYLKSNHKKDNELAYHLLNFKPELQPKNRMRQYHNFCKWYRENQPFLYFANESMLETCHPKFWRVNLPAKYLCREAVQEEALNDLERHQLQAFYRLDRGRQKLLSKYSYRLYQKDPNAWGHWFQSDVERQLQDCMQREGGVS
jgi:hypothetical protein